MARYTSENLVRRTLKSMGTAVIESTASDSTLGIDTAIEDGESYVLSRLPERYRQLALGNVYGEIVVWDAKSTTTSFTTSFYPVDTTAGQHFLWKNPGEDIDFHIDHINSEDNDSILTSGTDYTLTGATGSVTGLTLNKGWRLVMSYKYTTWTLFDPASPTTYYNVPRELTRLCTQAAAYFVLVDVYNIGRGDYLLNAENLALIKEGLDKALADVRDGKMSFAEYDDIDFYEDWLAGDPAQSAKPQSFEWGRG